MQDLFISYHIALTSFNIIRAGDISLTGGMLRKLFWGERVFLTSGCLTGEKRIHFFQYYLMVLSVKTVFCLRCKTYSY